MRPIGINIIKACSLALTLAAGASADLIHSQHPFAQGFGPGWSWQAPRHGWVTHRPNHFASNARDLQALLNEYARRTHTQPFGKPGIGPLDQDYPGPADLHHHDPIWPGSDADETDQDDDDSGTEIACQPSHDRFPQPTPPAVPEPGTLALVGAGVLGLLAARYCCKN